ncbi:hypothetical protein [Sphingomonas endophytica]|uniref:hypothetical protein n=1 Tax=Sphingomonas endophytica TaxID=869719 RepID=UPI00128E98FF|nr:hypothetical protein [Sphingomonas endophytica]
MCHDPTPINLPIYFQAGPGRHSVTAELALLACPLRILISLAIDTVLMGSIPGRIRAAVESDTVARLSKTIAAGHLSGADTGSGLATASAALVWVYGGSDARRLDPRPRFVQAELTRLGLRKAALVGTPRHRASTPHGNRYSRGRASSDALSPNSVRRSLYADGA